MREDSQISRRRRAAIAFAVSASASFLALLAIAASALAGTATNQRPLLYSFDGEDATAGRFVLGHPFAKFPGIAAGIGAVAVDYSTGDVYVSDNGAQAIDRFNFEGKAKDFPAGPATGTSSLFGPSVGHPFAEPNEFFLGGNSDLAVDNSGGLGGAGEGEQGRLYVGGFKIGPIHAFDPQGNLLWTLSTATTDLCGIAVDAEGHLWVGNGSSRKVLEFANSGSPPAKIGEFEVTSGNQTPCRLGIDRGGNQRYVALASSLGSPGEQGVVKFLGGALDSTLTDVGTSAVAVDQSEPAGHIFTLQRPVWRALESSLDEYEPCPAAGCGGTLLGSTGPGLIGNGSGVAYNPAKDWLYVSDGDTETVKVFGARASGAVPEVAAGEASEITKTEATAHGSINPGGLANSYHFEWVKAEVQRIVVSSKGGRFRLGTHRFGPKDETEPSSGLFFTERMPFNVSPTALQAELEAIYGAGNVSVTGSAASAGGPGEYRVLFKDELAGRFVSQMSGEFKETFEEGEEFEPRHATVTTVSQGQLWGDAKPAPTWPESNPSIDPTDNANHAVSAHFTGLRPNATYDVRLVGTNTEPEGDPEKRLNAYSNADTFTTLPPPPPVVSGLEVSGVTTESAHLAAMIDPQKDETIWRVLLSTEAAAGASQAECESLSATAFEVAGEGTIPLEEPGTVPIAEDLPGIEPSQTYCLRLVATNGGGNDQGGAVFTTKVIKPTEIALAFAAPRTDSSARLNFYVNPQGEAPLSYDFEYSLDGTTWTPLPERVSTTEAHQQIVLADELTGLTPNTTYFYRLVLVKNEAGEALKASFSAKKSFTTRTSAEMTLPANAFGEPERRGFELVNSPETGNQNVRAAELYTWMSPLRADGEEFLWTVFGGAPGANSGAQATFLAKRTAAGWISQSLVPPNSKQVGGGGLPYFPAAASSDFSSFIFAPALPTLLGTGPPTFVRLDLSGNQQILHAYQSPIQSRVDTTADAAHVLIVDPDTGKLEDIGSGSAEEIGLIPPAGAPLGVPQPGGSPPECGLDTEDRSFTGFGVGGAGSQFEKGYHRMASTDSSRVYFQVHPDGSGCAVGAPWALYERNREASPQTTTPIVPPAEATNDTAIIRATSDGRSADLLTSAKLDPADKNEDPDVYRWEDATGTSTCLTCVVSDAKVTGSVFVSDDFSHVYFNSTQQLVPRLGAAGENNLYVLNGGKVSFVARSVQLGGEMKLSADGNMLAFLSEQPLSADRIAPRCKFLGEGGETNPPCQELYLFDAREGSTECISCRQGTVTTNNVSLTGFGKPFQASADGSTLAFTTAEALVPRDVNNSADLYEWRNGSVRLISDGVTRYPIGYAAPIPQAVDANGSNIVFSIASPGLTGFERDGLANMYDARIGGGYARPTSAEHCSEESCQGPLQASPPSVQPGSASYEGRGNVVPRRPCRRNMARRHGRCVAKHPRRHGHRRAGNAATGMAK